MKWVMGEFRCTFVKNDFWLVLYCGVLSDLVVGHKQAMYVTYILNILENVKNVN